MSNFRFRTAAAALVGAAALTGATMLAHAQPYGGPGMMGGFGGGFGLFGPIFTVLAIAVIVVASVWFLRRFAPAGPHRMRCGHRSGLDVLEQRYASGAINREEYLQKKSDISG